MMGFLKRNEWSSPLEIYCARYFYGPIVITLGDIEQPYKLRDFRPELLIDTILPLIELTEKDEYK